jgi:hypothetical protein
LTVEENESNNNATLDVTLEEVREGVIIEGNENGNGNGNNTRVMLYKRSCLLELNQLGLCPNH